MSTSTLTARNKLKGKWLLLVAAVLALGGQLLHCLGSMVYLTYSFDYDDWYFGHLLELFDWYGWKTVLIETIPPIVTVVLVAIPVLLVLAYVLFAHKTRVGTLVLSLSIASLALPAIDALTCELPYFLEYYIEYGSLSDTIYSLQYFIESYYETLLPAAFSAFVVPALVLIAAVALLIAPKKVGKIVAVIGLSLATVTEFLAFAVTAIVYLTRMFEGFLSSYFVVYPIAEIAYLVFCGVLILTLILNRFDPVFGKQKPVQTEDVVVEIAEEPFNDANDSDEVVTEA